MNPSDMLAEGYQDLGDGNWFDPTDGSVWSADQGEWIYPAGQDVPALVTQAASSGWDVGTLSSNLLQAGYTVSQLAMLYQNVKSSSQATPSVLQYLQKENVALQQESSSKNSMWMWAAIGVAALLLVSNRRAAA